MAQQFLDVTVNPRLNVPEWNKVLKQIESSLGPLASGIKPLPVSDTFLKPLDEVKKKAGETGDEFDKLGKRGSALGKAFQFNMIIEGIKNVKEVVSELSDPFVKLDTATARIRTLGGESKRLAGDFRELSLKMSSDIPISAADMQTALYDALSAGIKPTQKGIESFMASAGKLAVGGGETIGNTVNLLSSITNAYGLAAESAGESSDYLFQTVNLGKTTIPELNQSLSQVVPNAAAAGINLKNVGASLALMTANGIPTAQSTTKLNQLIVELQKGSKELDPYLKKAGVTLDSLKKEDLIDNLARLRTAFDQSGKAATQVFGSVEAAAAFNVLTKDIGATRDMLGQMDNAAGSTQAAFEEMENTIAARSEKAKIAFETFVTRAIDKSGALGTVLVSGSKILGEMQAPIMALAGLKAVIPTQQIGQLATSLITKFVPAAVTTNAVTGATSISMKALAASTWTALAPMLPYIAAVAALGVAIYALDGGFKQSAQSKLDEANAQMKSNEQTQEAVKKTRDANTENLKLINTTIQLAAKEKLSADEKAKLKTNLDKLHTTYPGVITDTSNMDVVLASLGKSARDVVGGIGQYNEKLSKLQSAYKELRTVAIEAEFELGADVFQPGFLKAAFSSAERIAEIKMVGEKIENNLRATKSQKDVDNSLIYAMDVLKRHNMMSKEYADGVEKMIAARRKYFKQEQTEQSKLDSGGGGGGDDDKNTHKKIKNIQKEEGEIRSLWSLQDDYYKWQQHMREQADKFNTEITNEEDERRKKSLADLKKKFNEGWILTINGWVYNNPDEMRKQSKKISDEQQEAFDTTYGVLRQMSDMMINERRSFGQAMLIASLDALKAKVPIYVGEAIMNEIGSKGLLGVATGAIAAGLIYGWLSWIESKITASMKLGGVLGGRNKLALLNDAPGYPYEEIVMRAEPAAKNWADFIQINTENTTLTEHIRRHRPDIMMSLAEDMQSMRRQKEFFLNHLSGDSGIGSRELGELRNQVVVLTNELKEQKELTRKLLRLNNDWMNRDIRSRKREARSRKVIVEVEDRSYSRRVRAGG